MANSANPEINKKIATSALGTLVIATVFFYLGDRYAETLVTYPGQIFDHLSDAFLSMWQTIKDAPFALDMTSNSLLFGGACFLIIWMIWLRYVAFIGNYRSGEESGSARWGTVKEGKKFKDLQTEDILPDTLRVRKLDIGHENGKGMALLLVLHPRVVAEPSVHRNLLPLGEIGSKCFGSRTEQGAIDKHRRIDIFAGLAVLLLLVDGESEGEDTRGIPLFAKLRIAREVAHDGYSVDSHCLSNLSMVFAEDSGILLPGKLSSLAVYKYSRPEYQQPREQDNHIDCTHLRCKDKGV